MTRLATTRDETPVFIRAGDDDLFGILTRPTAAPTGAAVLLAWGAAIDPSSGRNQLRTRLARRLAAAGYHVMRMDYRGVGDSSGTRALARTDQPPTDDVRAVCGWLLAQGLGPVVLVGSCLGARAVLATATAVNELAGVGLVLCPVRDENHFHRAVHRKPLSFYAKQAVRPVVLRGLADPATRKVYSRWVSGKLRSLKGTGSGRPSSGSTVADGWVSPTFLGQVQQLVDADIPLLFLYASGDPFYEDFLQAQRGRLGALLDRAGDLATIRVIDTQAYLYANTASQDEVVDCLGAWLSALGNSTTPLPVRGRAQAAPPA